MKLCLLVVSLALFYGCAGERPTKLECTSKEPLPKHIKSPMKLYIDLEEGIWITDYGRTPQEWSLGDEIEQDMIELRLGHSDCVYKCSYYYVDRTTLDFTFYYGTADSPSKKYLLQCAVADFEIETKI